MNGKLVYGVGRYENPLIPAKVNGRPTMEYSLWLRMLERCYSSIFLAKRKSYAGCSVDSRFHDFNEFTLWAQKQIGFGQPDYHLDKDILGNDGKIYSPETCAFVPRAINMLLTNAAASRGDHPIGVDFHKASGKFKAQIRIDGKQEHLGLFGTSDEAFSAYKAAKEAQIKIIAEKYKNAVDPRVYATLINYKISKTD